MLTSFSFSLWYHKSSMTCVAEVTEFQKDSFHTHPSTPPTGLCLPSAQGCPLPLCFQIFSPIKDPYPFLGATSYVSNTSVSTDISILCPVKTCESL